MSSTSKVDPLSMSLDDIIKNKPKQPKFGKQNKANTTQNSNGSSGLKKVGGKQQVQKKPVANKAQSSNTRNIRPGMKTLIPGTIQAMGRARVSPYGRMNPRKQNQLASEQMMYLPNAQTQSGMPMPLMALEPLPMKMAPRTARRSFGNAAASMALTGAPVPVPMQMMPFHSDQAQPRTFNNQQQSQPSKRNLSKAPIAEKSDAGKARQGGQAGGKLFTGTVLEIDPLNSDIVESDIKELCGKYGEVKEVKLMESRKVKSEKMKFQKAEVRFRRREDAMEAQKKLDKRALDETVMNVVLRN